MSSSWYGSTISQSQITRRLGGARERARIVAILSQEHFASRSTLGRRICREFSFLDTTGRPQLAGGMKALSALAEREPDIVLPAARAPAVDNRPHLLAPGVPEPEEVPEHPASIRGLVLTVVTSPSDRAVWNTLIAHEHPHGLTTFAGCQVRYLIGSAHGWLGAAGFSAAALRCAARDRWMAWSDEQRRDHLTG